MNFKENLINKFNQLEISKAKCIFVANDMGNIGLIEQETKKSMLNSIYESIIEINPKVTIVVPTPTIYLIGTDKVFDLNFTPSIKMGAFSEYIRKLKGSKEFQDQEERLLIISNLQIVDKTILAIDKDRTVTQTIQKIHNEYSKNYKLGFANGGDQNNNTIPERTICEKLGIQLIDGLGDKIQSSSWLLKNKSIS